MLEGTQLTMQINNRLLLSPVLRIDGQEGAMTAFRHLAEFITYLAFASPLINDIFCTTGNRFSRYLPAMTHEQQTHPGTDPCRTTVSDVFCKNNPMVRRFRL